MFGVPGLRVGKDRTTQGEPLLSEPVAGKLRWEEEEEVDVEPVGQVGPAGRASRYQGAHEGARAFLGGRTNPVDELSADPRHALLHLGRRRDPLGDLELEPVGLGIRPSGPTRTLHTRPTPPRGMNLRLEVGWTLRQG